MAKIVNICDVCSEIFAGGDAPKGNMSETKTEEYNIPIYANGEANEGLYGYTNKARVTKPSITVSARGTIGYTAIRPTPFVPIVRLITLTPNPELIDIKYLYYAAQNYKFDGSGTSIPQLTVPSLKKYSFPLPAMEEQAHIVMILDNVCDLIDQKKQQLELLDELVKSRFIELFGDLERTTTIARYISELRGGKSLAGTEPCKNKVLKTGAATFGWFDPEQYKYLPADYEPLPEHKVETGDVIISRMNTPELVGACSYVFDAPDDMYYPDRLWKAVLKENTNPIFLWQLLWDRDIRKAIKESSGGTSGTMHNISKTNLLAIKCMDAPIELQNEYAEFVKPTDKSKLAVQQSIAELEELKKSLMQKYFG